MAISIINDPASEGNVHCTREGIFLRARGTDYILQSPSVSQISFSFSTEPTAGDALNISVLGSVYTVNFIALNTNRPLGSCYVRDAGNITLRDWILNQLFFCLREFPVFEDFDFGVSGPSSVITITSTQFKSYSLAVTADGFNIANNGQIGGSALQVRNDYNIRVQALLNDTQQSVNFPLRTSWHYFKPNLIDGNAEIHVDMGEIIGDMMQDEDVPAETNAQAQALSRSARKVFFRLQEYFGEEPGQNFSTVTGVFRVLKGGRDPFDRAQLLSNMSKPKFLTNRDEVYTDARLRDWLYFIEPSVAANQRIWVRTKTQYVDGVLTERNTLQVIPSEPNRIVRIPCGFNQLGLDAFPGIPIAYSVSIVITDNLNNVINNVIGELWFKLLDESDYRSGLQYFNTFGLLESITLDGSGEAVIEWNRKVERIQLTGPINGTTFQEVAYDCEKNFQLNVTTGPLNKLSWASIGDVMISKKHYWIDFITNTSKRFACTLEKGKTQLDIYNPDGNGFSQVPLVLNFTAEKTHSPAINIIDIY